MDQQGIERPALSRQQREFAERMACRQDVLALEESHAVCFYRKLASETIRWIVDVDGHVLDWSVFRCGS